MEFMMYPNNINTPISSFATTGNYSNIGNSNNCRNFQASVVHPTTSFHNSKIKRKWHQEEEENRENEQQQQEQRNGRAIAYSLVDGVKRMKVSSPTNTSTTCSFVSSSPATSSSSYVTQPSLSKVTTTLGGSNSMSNYYQQQQQRPTAAMQYQDQDDDSMQDDNSSEDDEICQIEPLQAIKINEKQEHHAIVPVSKVKTIHSKSFMIKPTSSNHSSKYPIEIPVDATNTKALVLYDPYKAARLASTAANSSMIQPQVELVETDEESTTEDDSDLDENATHFVRFEEIEEEPKSSAKQFDEPEDMDVDMMEID